jgi:RNA polymerase sigma factor (sigma-70 family)
MTDDALENQSENQEALPGPAIKRRDQFVTTQWSVVLKAATQDHEKAAVALHWLCTNYWYPVYAFIRRRGSDIHEAEDLTQAFFAYLLEEQTLKKVDREKGRFRSFLLTVLTNFLNNEWDRRHTLKRGGGKKIVSLDEVAADGLYRNEPSATLPPEKLFDRRWASTLVEKVLVELRDEYQSVQNSKLLARLEPLLTQDVSPGLAADLALEFGTSEGAVKVALHRLRRRFGELLRREVGLTVADASSLDEEVHYLLSALSE